MTKIPPFYLKLIPLNEEANKLPSFRWADDAIGKRHKLGGEPDYIQSKEVPICPECRKEMIFYAQLDSLNDEFCIADCGMIYIFICFDCNNVVSFIQSF
ncbi:MAG: DUF1963 domain-containing protein [Candidatus Auribacterota bacterium]|jgi:hypothetical protein|nr:DUF1963 domain-containing protein [Candidatus Auribacterota bacterium]